MANVRIWESFFFFFGDFDLRICSSFWQAMAAGLPIIASDIRGNRDLLASEPHTRSKHYLLPTKDADAYAAKINKILDDPALAQALGTENHANCKKYFDIALVHNLMTTIYTELTD